MSDIGLDSNFMRGFPQEYVYIFLIGFLPGFYISYLRNKRQDFTKFILNSLFIGVLFGCINFILFGSLAGYSEHTLPFQFLQYILTIIPYLCVIEVLIILIHFFFFKKSKKKTK